MRGEVLASSRIRQLKIEKYKDRFPISRE